MNERPVPSPEVRAILKEFCKKQEEKYGPDWKKILAAEMAEKTTPVLLALQKLMKK